jgi:hypothetical protein
MPKLVSVLRPEKIQEQARIYVRSYILMPAGVVGLVCMIGGVGSLGYQLLANHTYTWLTFLASSGLLVVGAFCGWRTSPRCMQHECEPPFFDIPRKLKPSRKCRRLITQDEASFR